MAQHFATVIMLMHMAVYAGQLGQVDGLLQPGDADAASTGTGAF
jgi:hypothetical protein